MPNPMIEQLIDARQVYKPAALKAVKAFARSKPWAGTIEERAQKFQTLHTALCTAYEVNFRLAFLELGASDAHSRYEVNDESHELIYTGRLSVLTYFFAFAECRGFDISARAKWSLTLFKRCFPKSFDRLNVTRQGIVSTPRAN